MSVHFPLTSFPHLFELELELALNLVLSSYLHRLPLALLLRSPLLVSLHFSEIIRTIIIGWVLTASLCLASKGPQKGGPIVASFMIIEDMVGLNGCLLLIQALNCP